MNPIIGAALISSVSTLTGVILTTRAQDRRIDRDNRAALDAQTAELKQHLTGGEPR